MLLGMLHRLALFTGFAFVATSIGCGIATDGIFAGAGGEGPAATGGAHAPTTSSGTNAQGGGRQGSGGHGGTVSVGAGGPGGQGGGAQGGGNASGGSGQGGHSPDCDMLLQNVNDALAKAQACTPPLLGGDTPCKSVEMGVCCPVVVAFGDSSETNDYLAALAVYENDGCHAQCPDKTCDQHPSATCQAPLGQTGTCVTN
jgi:hypothetical protein